MEDDTTITGPHGPDTSVFTHHESNVRSYCRNMPAVFTTASGARMQDTEGRSYIDLLAGAGTLNYGHNDPAIVDRVTAYLQRGGVVHSLDLYTEAKAEFIEAFQDRVLVPRGLTYKMQFPGPTGTNAVEAALKLARKVTGRSNVVAFTHGFHGMTLGALAATSNEGKRGGAGLALGNTTFMPYDGFLGEGVDAMDVVEAMIRQPGSGIDRPAAFVVETVQGEGGLNTAGADWMRRLATLAKEVGALLIVDDIQAGNGRTGTFFSFEPFGIVPDIVVLSKSLSGFGAPFGVVLFSPHLDVWSPGEHNGTFRGHNLAFVGATAAIETYWTDGRLQDRIAAKAATVADALHGIADELPEGAARVKGRGLFTGLEFSRAEVAGLVAQRLFDAGVVIETCGHRDQVLKLLPPLTIPDADLGEALDLIAQAVQAEATVAASVD